MTRLALCIAACVVARAAAAQLTVRLPGVPAGTPPDAALHVAGSFNGWNPGDPRYRLTRQPDGAYALTLPTSVRGGIEFKLTRGSWATVETTAAGADVPNRTYTVPAEGAATLTVAVAAWHDATPRAAKPSTATRSVTVLSDSFPIASLRRVRRVWIYLPPGYAASRERYPVLYVQDGQNAFDAATSFSGEWGLDESLDSLRARGDRGVIVVAVDNGGDRRMDEYDPWRNADRSLGGGEGDAYVDFLVRELKPYVDRRFRTLPDRAHTGVLGSSMGGLIALYAALARGDVFGRAGVFSCACWVADPQIYALARRARPRPDTRLFFVSGAFETASGRPATDQRRVVDALVAAGFTVGTSIRASAPADGKHAEWFWRREFPAAYLWLFGERGR